MSLLLLLPLLHLVMGKERRTILNDSIETQRTIPNNAAVLMLLQDTLPPLLSSCFFTFNGQSSASERVGDLTCLGSGHSSSSSPMSCHSHLPLFHRTDRLCPIHPSIHPLNPSSAHHNRHNHVVTSHPVTCLFNYSINEIVLLSITTILIEPLFKSRVICF